MSHDMGGSTGVSLCPGELLYTREFEIAGQPVVIPVIDTHTVAPRADLSPALTPEAPRGWARNPLEPIRGPSVMVERSGRRGDRCRRLDFPPMRSVGVRVCSTETDSSAALLGSKNASVEASSRSCRDLAVADAAMERALRVMSVERGYDPAHFALVAFSGAGALHAAELARRLGRGPRNCATHAGAALHLQRGVEKGVRLHRWVAAVHAPHVERYGYRCERLAVEAVTLRVMATAPGPDVRIERLGPAARGVPVAPTGVHVRDRWVRASHVWRDKLGPGHEAEGPAVVSEYSSTTWIPQGWWLTVDACGHLHLENPTQPDLTTWRFEGLEAEVSYLQWCSRCAILEPVGLLSPRKTR